MKNTAVSHPKTLMLAQLLADDEHRDDRRLVIGTLELLWQYAAAYADDGLILEPHYRRLAAFFGYRGDIVTLLEALRESEYLDAVEGGYRIHDWDEHLPDYVKERRRKREYRAQKEAATDNPGTTPDGHGTRRDNPGTTLGQPRTDTGQPRTDPDGRAPKAPTSTSTYTLTTTNTPAECPPTGPLPAPKAAQQQSAGLGSEATLGQEANGQAAPRPEAKPASTAALDKLPAGAFAQWYAAYPRKVKRKRAEDSYRPSVLRLAADMKRRGPKGQEVTAAEAHAAMMQAVEEFARSPKGQHKQFCPHPSSWLNGDCWGDDRSDWQVAGDQTSKPRGGSLSRVLELMSDAAE